MSSKPAWNVKNVTFQNKIQCIGNLGRKFAKGEVVASVTRLDDLVQFGQLFEASGNNKFAYILSNFFHFSSEIILGNFYRHLANFWSHWFGIFYLLSTVVSYWKEENK